MKYRTHMNYDSFSSSFERFIRICYMCQLLPSVALSPRRVRMYKMFVIVFPIVFYIPKWFEIRWDYFFFKLKRKSMLILGFPFIGLCTGTSLGTAVSSSGLPTSQRRALCTGMYVHPGLVGNTIEKSKIQITVLLKMRTIKYFDA